MTNKTAQFIPAVQYDVEVDDIENDQEPLTDEEQKLSELVDALSSDSQAYVSVHREVTGQHQAEFIKRIPVDKFDHAQILENLRLEYGGGDYRLRVYVKGKIKSNKLFTIAHASITNKSGDENGTLKLVMDRMEKMQQQMMNLAHEAKSGGGSRMEMMQEMMLMKEIFSQPQNNHRSGGIGEMLEMIEGLKALGVNIGGQEEKEEKGFSSLLEMAAPLFLGGMQQPQQRQQIQHQQLQQPIPQQQIDPQIAAKIKQQQNEQKEMSIALNFGLAQMIKAAAKNADPANYSGMIIDNVSEEVLMGFFKDAAGLQKLVALKPEIANHLVWFEELGEHVKAGLGLPSKVDHLYNDLEDDNLDETQNVSDTHDGTTSDLSATSDT